MKRTRIPYFSASHCMYVCDNLGTSKPVPEPSVDIVAQTSGL